MTSDRTGQCLVFPDWLPPLPEAARRRAHEIAVSAPPMDATTRAAVALLVRPAAPTDTAIPRAA